MSQPRSKPSSKRSSRGNSPASQIMQSAQSGTAVVHAAAGAAEGTAARGSALAGGDVVTVSPLTPAPSGGGAAAAVGADAATAPAPPPLAGALPPVGPGASGDAGAAGAGGPSAAAGAAAAGRPSTDAGVTTSTSTSSTGAAGAAGATAAGGPGAAPGATLPLDVMLAALRDMMASQLAGLQNTAPPAGRVGQGPTTGNAPAGGAAAAAAAWQPDADSAAVYAMVEAKTHASGEKELSDLLRDLGILRGSGEMRFTPEALHVLRELRKFQYTAMPGLRSVMGDAPTYHSQAAVGRPLLRAEKPSAATKISTLNAVQVVLGWVGHALYPASGVEHYTTTTKRLGREIGLLNLEQLNAQLSEDDEDWLRLFYAGAVVLDFLRRLSQQALRLDVNTTVQDLADPFMRSLDLVVNSSGAEPIAARRDAAEATLRRNNTLQYKPAGAGQGASAESVPRRLLTIVFGNIAGRLLEALLLEPGSPSATEVHHRADRAAGGARVPAAAVGGGRAPRQRARPTDEDEGGPRRPGHAAPLPPFPEPDAMITELLGTTGEGATRSCMARAIEAYGESHGRGNAQDAWGHLRTKYRGEDLWTQLKTKPKEGQPNPQQAGGRGRGRR